MTRRRSLYARPAIVQGQQCAEARLGRRSDRAAACHGGGQAPPQEGDPPRSPCRCAVLVGCSPRRLCPAEPPASRYRRRSRPCQDTSHGVSRRSASGGVHPSGSVVRDPAVRPVRCPARPSGRVRLVPIRRWRLGTGRCGTASSTTARTRVPVGCRVTERLGSTAEPARTRAAAAFDAGLPAGQARAPSARRRRRHEAREEAAARGGRSGREAAVLGMGGRPR
jgi:hypothetical protein